MLEVFAGWVNDLSGALPDLSWIAVIARALVVIASAGILLQLGWLAHRRRDLQPKWPILLPALIAGAIAAQYLATFFDVGRPQPWFSAISAAIALVAVLLLAALLPRLSRQPAASEYQFAYQQLAEQHRLLSESESRFRVLIETTSEGVWVVDRDGVTTFANAAMGEMLGCSAALVGRSLFDFVFAEEQVSAQARLEQRLAGDRRRIEFRWRRVDGTPLHTLISTSVLLAPNGRISGLMGLVTDISEIVALREQLQSLNLELGQRVELRTRELEESNRELAREIVVREYVQSELAASNERLNHYLTELQRHTEDITRLNELSDQLHACAGRRELIPVLQGSCLDLFGATGGALFELKGEQLQLLGFGWGDCSGLESTFPCSHCMGIASGKPFPGNSSEQDGAVCLHRPSLLPTLCVPLLSRGQRVGLLMLQRQQPFWSGQEASDRQIAQLVRALAEHTALALDNLSLREELREQSFSDPLTGLSNRRYLFEQMAREKARWEREQRPFALMLIDIDHFKSFNDRYGHDVGDTVLLAVAELLREYTRRSDLACRFGGEEFIVLMAGVEQEQAWRRAEAIREAVKRLRLDGVADAISISAGVAMYPDHGDDSHDLLRAADQALYVSKRSGRDRTSLAG